MSGGQAWSLVLPQLLDCQFRVADDRPERSSRQELLVVRNGQANTRAIWISEQGMAVPDMVRRTPSVPSLR
jgi:hypothetical protein